MSKPQPEQRRGPWWTRVSYEAVTPAIGLGLVTLAALGWIPKNPELYPVYAGMIGLGSVVKFASNKQRDKDADK